MVTKVIVQYGAVLFSLTNDPESDRAIVAMTQSIPVQERRQVGRRWMVEATEANIQRLCLNVAGFRQKYVEASRLLEHPQPVLCPSSCDPALHAFAGATHRTVGAHGPVPMNRLVTHRAEVVAITDAVYAPAQGRILFAAWDLCGEVGAPLRYQDWILVIESVHETIERVVEKGSPRGPLWRGVLCQVLPLPFSPRSPRCNNGLP